MIRTKIAFCADNVIRDAQTNLLTAVAIFDQLNPISFPFALPRMFMLFILERDLPGDPQVTDLMLRTRLDDQQLAETPVRVDFGTSRYTRSIIGFLGFLVPAPGIVRFELFEQQRIIGTYELRCDPAPPALVHA